jgi:aryl-alcohol dehydrogenase-like predicted oxidoreductase
MEYRVLGRTERPVSDIGLGTWQLGADWGEVSETAALDVLGSAVESGVTFFDTADVYGDGRSEQLTRFRRTSGCRTSGLGPTGRGAIWAWTD